MKTTDGFEIKKNTYYFTEKGESIILNSCATTDDGKDVFMVTPMYEGEAMTCNCDAGYHSEVTVDYEHEGEETLVYAIFETAPLEKLDHAYMARLKDIEHLSLATGELKKSSERINNTIKKLNREIKECYGQSKIAERLSGDKKLELEKINGEISEKRQALSELEDSISTLKSEDLSSLISKTELKRLNKRDFELQCLETGGVDNWEWYSESLKDFKERYPED